MANFDWVNQGPKYEVEEPDPCELPMYPFGQQLPPSELDDEELENYYEECMAASKRTEIQEEAIKETLEQNGNDQFRAVYSFI